MKPANFLFMALAAGLSAALAAPVAAQQTLAADHAWNQGDYAAAESLYSQRLASDSSDVRALHRLALLLAWGEHYDSSLALFDRLARLDPNNLEAAVDRARVLAWRSDHRQAILAVNTVLARQPQYLPALQARAQFEGWAGDYNAALASYDRILELSPGDPAARRQRAQILSWSDRLEEAADAFADLLRVEPEDRDSRMMLARVLSWTSQLDSAAAVYRGILAKEPGDLEALQGVARTTSWSGQLRRAEPLWREALALAPDNVGSLLGLSQTLRWQGRHAEAVPFAERALGLAPGDADARAEFRYARLGIAPRVLPSFTHERDSDGNNLSTMAVSASWYPLARLQVGVDGYWRELEQTGPGGFNRTTRGAQASLGLAVANGWTVSVGAGSSASTTPGSDYIPRLQLGVRSPTWLPVRAGLGYARRALDGTARLVENGIVVDELALDAGFTLGSAWSLETRITAADFTGESGNRRYLGRADLGVRVARDWRVGLGAMAFRFDDHTEEGYFNPDFYGLGELSGRWLRDLGRWSLLLEAAPGVQQVGEGHPWKGTLRTHARVAYNIAPGRQLGIGAGYSSHGIESVGSTTSDYRYRSLTISGGWAF
jgi:tetratricopeptide (TPR) repeat protein